MSIIVSHIDVLRGEYYGLVIMQCLKKLLVGLITHKLVFQLLSYLIYMYMYMM